MLVWFMGGRVAGCCGGLMVGWYLYGIVLVLW